MLQGVNLIRNVLILLPLALTWFALQQATILYQADLVRNPGDVNRPFLDLWQNGFGDHNLWLTFAHVALLDLLLYLLLILVGVIADNIVRRSQTRARRLQELITSATDELSTVAIGLSNNMGANATDVGPWMTQIQSVLTDATNLVRQVGQQMAEFQANVTALGASAASLGVSASTIGTSANQLATEARNLTAAVQSISGSAGQMATASGQISREVNGLTQAQQRGNDRLQQLVNEVHAVSDHARRSADAIQSTVQRYGTVLRDAGLAQRKLVDRMQRIHKQQATMLARLLGRGSGRGLRTILFGRNRDSDEDAWSDDWIPPDVQNTPAGHPTPPIMNPNGAADPR